MLGRAALPFAILTGFALFATPATTITSFRGMTTALKTFFNPTRSGTYKFEARTRITNTGNTSGWSPVLTLTIS